MLNCFISQENLQGDENFLEQTLVAAHSAMVRGLVPGDWVEWRNSAVGSGEWRAYRVRSVAADGRSLELVRPFDGERLLLLNIFKSNNIFPDPFDIISLCMLSLCLQILSSMQ